PSPAQERGCCLLLEGNQPGGNGGGVFAKSDCSSSTSLALTHCAMPAFHTSESRFSWPPATWPCSAPMSNGPTCWPFTATWYATAPGNGGGTAPPPAMPPPIPMAPPI